MRQRRESRHVQRRQQEPDRDADRLAHVVVLALLTVLVQSPRLLEDGDQARRLGQMWLRRVGADRLDRTEVLSARALLVEQPLFALGGLADALLRVVVGDDDERPRLLVRAGWRRPGDAQRVLDQLPRHRIGSEAAHRAPCQHRRQVRVRTRECLRGWDALDRVPLWCVHRH